jgi:hypothetical protein
VKKRLEQYAARHFLGDPDPFRLRYRAQIREFVARVVLERMDKKAAAGWIAGKAAAGIPADDISGVSSKSLKQS